MCPVGKMGLPSSEKRLVASGIRPRPCVARIDWHRLVLRDSPAWRVKRCLANWDGRRSGGNACSGRAEDSNTQQAAPGYVVSNLRMHVTQRWAEWEFRQFIRINNLSDHKYVGSLIVGDSSKRYYEAAPGRTWQAGFRVLKRF